MGCEEQDTASSEPELRPLMTNELRREPWRYCRERGSEQCIIIMRMARQGI
jgi:hypothetical protein